MTGHTSDPPEERHGSADNDVRRGTPRHRRVPAPGKPGRCRARGALRSAGPEGVRPQRVAPVGAGPVLDQLEASPAGTGFSTILGDRECRIVRRWDDDPRTREGLDLLNIREGTSMLEENVGTNGLGTVFETRHPVVIHGSEHFAESLRHFSCYGHPIRHPLTRRIEGVLDISALVDTASPLLPPLIARAVHDIEQRLLDGSRISEKSLLAAFQEASGHSKHAVPAIGEDIVMSNRAASSLLSSSDIALLRVLGEDPPASSDSTLRFTLETGRAADVTVTRVPGSAPRGPAPGGRAVLRAASDSSVDESGPGAGQGARSDLGVRATRHRTVDPGEGARQPAHQGLPRRDGSAGGAGGVGEGVRRRNAPTGWQRRRRGHRPVVGRAARPRHRPGRPALATPAGLHLGPGRDAHRQGGHPRPGPRSSATS
ncbi:hypothetical protein LP422_05515 [Janibacter limosus]|uniref:Uncharacterized protein n=1 Tax=Janibacter limosus TaxID=53458 RepID=A0AC61U6U2_9MICO|nr:GAF domain-containing protein [Janibacter limosus]UUZ45552.1 hypothetical protein LP422_05515 [Janibacter limosus]